MRKLNTIIESYKARNSFYPEKVLADKTYRNRKNLNYCKENGISITQPALVRPKKNRTRAEKIKNMLIHAKEMKLKENLALVKLDMV
jgi:hypothetical protein